MKNFPNQYIVQQTFRSGLEWIFVRKIIIKRIKTMVKNKYFLMVGILTILFSVSHALNGQTTVLPVINESNVDQATKTTIFYVWHIITAENLVFGVAFIFMAFIPDFSKVRFTAVLLTFVMVARWVVIFGSEAYKNPNGLLDNLMDLVVILLYVGLIVLGILKKEKS